jgi:hypothetical protein
MLPPASPAPQSAQAPQKKPTAAQAHVLASTAGDTALQNIKDERPAARSLRFGDGIAAQINSIDSDNDDTGTTTADNAGGSRTDGAATAHRTALKSALLALGARPEHIEEAIAASPLARNQQLLAFALMREIGVSLANAGRYAGEDIPLLAGKSEQQSRLAYCLGRTAGLDDAAAKDFSAASSIASNVAHFHEAANLSNSASDPAARVNYCVLRAMDIDLDISEEWANIGPGGGAAIYTHGIEKLTAIYQDQANLELRPGVFPRFIGNAIPAPDGKKALLGTGQFNAVELLRIIDPRTNQEREFAFKPSKPNASTGLGAHLSGIAAHACYPETRNLAAVAVAGALGLLGKDGVTGDAFMGIVDGRPGLLMEVAAGKPMAHPNFNIRLNPDSSDYARLTHPLIKEQVLADPAVARAQADILGVHSIRYDGDDVILTGSVTDLKHPDTLEPYWNNDPSLKKAYARIEFFDRLINESDCHPGNIIVEKNKEDGRYYARRIDLDQSFGSKSNIVLGHANSFMTYYLPIPARYIDRELADKMRLPATRAAVEAAVSDKLTVPVEIKACMIRFDLMLAAINNNEIAIIDNDENWHKVEMNNPLTSLFARDGLRPKRTS